MELNNSLPPEKRPEEQRLPGGEAALPRGALRCPCGRSPACGARGAPGPTRCILGSGAQKWGRGALWWHLLPVGSPRVGRGGRGTLGPTGRFGVLIGCVCKCMSMYVYVVVFYIYMYIHIFIYILIYINVYIRIY